MKDTISYIEQAIFDRSQLEKFNEIRKVLDGYFIRNAQELVNRFHQYEEKIKYITLEVRVSNEPAINLYSKYGFSSFGTRKGYYQDNNEDALIMWTKNIFFDEFKDKYTETIKNLEGKINIQ